MNNLSYIFYIKTCTRTLSLYLSLFTDSLISLIHKATWKSPDLSTKTHMKLLDVRAQRGTDAGSDYDVILAKIKARIAKRNQPRQKQQRRFDTEKLFNKCERRLLYYPEEPVLSTRRLKQWFCGLQVGASKDSPTIHL